MRSFYLSLFLLLALASLPSPIRAQEVTQPAENPAGAVVCLPGLYALLPDDCLPLGPSVDFARAAAQGVPQPPLPLPSYSPDPELNYIPYQYFKVNEAGTPLYLSLQSGLNDQFSTSLAPGFLYVSYQSRADTDQGVFYQLRSGAWIRGDGARAGVPSFQGLLLSATPPNAFGWILGEVASRTSPSFNAPLTGRTYYRYNVVQVYSLQEAEGITWLLVGRDEWLDYRHVARVTPSLTPPAGVSASRWIEVNLDEQTLAVYQDEQLVFATVIASGVEPFWTRPGLFQIYEKKPTETMSGSTTSDRSDYYYLEDVPWTMYFDEKRALHGAYWHNFFGYPRSHGCINLSVGDSHWLFDWAVEGDFIYIYDPSGRTPTDPALFGSGAP